MPSMLSGAFCLSQDRNSQFSSSCSCESRWILNRSVSISGAAGLLPLRLYHSGVVSHDDSYLVHDVHGWGCAFARPLTYQRSNFGAHFRKLGHRYDPFALGSPFAPIQALDLICQNRAWTRPGNHHFKGIVLDLRRHRAADHQTGLRVICGGAQHNCGPVPRLFMSSLWVEADPDYVPSVGHIGLRHYNASLPTGLPKSASSCKFSRVIPFTSSVRSYSLRCAGSMTIRPDSSRTSTASSTPRWAASIRAAGIRTEALLPHFLTTVLISSLLLYLHCSDILSGIQACVNNVDTVHELCKNPAFSVHWR